MHDLLFVILDFSTMSLVSLKCSQLLVESIGWLQRVVGHSCAVSVGETEDVLGANRSSRFLGLVDILLGEKGI